ncbi:Gfo/Idh/MocA family oxidoreductase [Paenibacillus sp. TRM 82003]|nr:Gfo/Idh/MocA family oxidoreductase [Paenibacillus sp. TRM 82003]
MMVTIRIGKISYWHVHAKDYTKQAIEHPDTAIVAVWDELPARGREEAKRLGVPFYASLSVMLREADIDAVVVDAPTNWHRDIMVEAARAGKHIFTEKVVAATQREAKEIVDEARKAGVTLTVSLPRLNEGYTLAIRKLLSEERLGKVTLVRVRLSHNGATAGWLPEHFYNLEQCQGGALIDLGCHPMYLARLFLGEEPSDVTSTFGYVTGKAVEDNAVAVLSTPSGAAAVVEAGFVNAYSPFSIEIHGTEGTLLYGTPEPKLLLRDKGADDWQSIELPPNRESAFEQWVSHILDGTEAEENVRIGMELTRLMEAAYRSAREKRAVRLEELET